MTAVNVLEFKSPEDAADPWHLERLLAVATGLAVSTAEDEKAFGAYDFANLSMWLLTPKITRNLATRLARTGFVAVSDRPGLHLGQVLEHPIWVAAYNELGVEIDTLPLQLLTQRSPPARQAETARVLTEMPDFLQRVGELIRVLRPEIWEMIMNEVSIPGPKINWERVQRVVNLSESLKDLPLEVRLAALRPEERLVGLGAADRLAGLSLDEIQRWLDAQRAGTQPTTE